MKAEVLTVESSLAKRAVPPVVVFSEISGYPGIPQGKILARIALQRILRDKK